MADDRPMNGQIIAPPQRDRHGQFLPGHVKLGGNRRGTQHKMTAKLYRLIDDELERRGLSAVRALDDADLLKLAALCRIKDDAPEHTNEELPKFKSSAEMLEHIRQEHGDEATAAFKRAMDLMEPEPFWPSQRKRWHQERQGGDDPES
jgi:hypothetical protein